MRALLIIFVVAIVTGALRLVPFLVYENREIPSILIYLGRVLPFSIMAMLVVYCVRGINLFQGNRGLPEILAIFFVAIIHKIRRNALLSIGFGTIFYMFLIQRVFS